MQNNKKDIWTMCEICRIAFLAKSPEAPFCTLCLEELKDRNEYERRTSWKEE